MIQVSAEVLGKGVNWGCRIEGRSSMAEVRYFQTRI